MSSQIAEAQANLLRLIVRGLAEKGNLDHAREIAQAMRIACDESTAVINEAAKGASR